MHVKFHTDPTTFEARELSLLRERVAENNIMLGGIRKLAAQYGHALPETETPMLCTVEDGDALIGVALQMGPWPLSLSRQPLEAVQALAAAVADVGRAIPFVVGPRDRAEQFADVWQRTTGASVASIRPLDLFELGALQDIVAPPGEPVVATPDDFALVVRWEQAFESELGLPHADAESDMRDRIANQALLLWRDGETVAMAGFRDVLPDTARVSLVYTPPHARRRGYAMGVVHALSERLVTSGKTHCFLFTDANDPGPNALYPQIGYRRIDTFAEITFT